MASLVSPGVSVPVINESFYMPAAAPTVPLFFVATQSNKLQPDGITQAQGTQESDVVRTVTSIGQSAQLYGIPYFWKDGQGNEFHGDPRNEYGLFALNQFLGVGNRAYVVRANVDLADAVTSFLGIGTAVVGPTITDIGVGNATIGSISVPSEFVRPQTITVVMNGPSTFTVIGSIDGIIGFGTVGVAFTSRIVHFTMTAGSIAHEPEDYFEFDLVYTHTTKTGTGNGVLSALKPDATLPAVTANAETWTITFTNATTFTVSGSLSGAVTTALIDGVTATAPFTLSGTVGARTALFDNDKIGFRVTEGSTPFATDVFTVALLKIDLYNPLGSTTAEKRQTIVTALQATINMNADARATEKFEYNLIVAPGYPEVMDELLALNVSIDEEAFIIADTPVDKTPEQAANWSLTSARQFNNNIAYYYPWGLASNLDGRDVVVAPSGIALRTYAYSDNQSYVWFAPAGARRGVVTGVSQVGYVTGEIGKPTKFVEVALNQGQRDNLYEAQKNINPIVFFYGRGIIIWGQKTSANAASALDRVNAVRLVCYLKRVLRKGAFPFVFEPNDQITRDNLKAAADGLLNDVMSKRGLYDFATMSNEANNTPFRIDNNELWMDVAIKPVKAAEFIYIPIRVLSTGAAMPS